MRRLRSLLAGPPEPVPAGRPPLRVHRIEGLEAYRTHMEGPGAHAWDLELALAEAHPDVDFKVPGLCWIDQVAVEFEMDYRYAQDLGTRRIPNWRERMVCPVCRLNNRQRGCMHVATDHLGLTRESRVYMTEQVTPAYSHLRSRYAAVVGSEFLGPDLQPGFVNDAGIRHEDLTRLSFPDASFDAILTFDVLEHVPRYRNALAECHRVLAPGGSVLFSIPFVENSPTTRTRAHFAADGTLVHDQPPAYHGDPVKPGEGVLCFHDFGWDILEDARHAGFADAAALIYRDPGYGYLGGWPILFTARK